MRRFWASLREAGFTAPILRAGARSPEPKRSSGTIPQAVTSPKLLLGWKHSFANHHAWVLYHPPPSPRIRHAYAWCLLTRQK